MDLKSALAAAMPRLDSRAAARAEIKSNFRAALEEMDRERQARDERAARANLEIRPLADIWADDMCLLFASAPTVVEPRCGRLKIPNHSVREDYSARPEIKRLRQRGLKTRL